MRVDSVDLEAAMPTPPRGTPNPMRAPDSRSYGGGDLPPYGNSNRGIPSPHEYPHPNTPPQDEDAWASNNSVHAQPGDRSRIPIRRRAPQGVGSPTHTSPVDASESVPLLERPENRPIWTGCDGRYWPLLQDKVRGAVRSRALLTLVYMYLALLVALYVALIFAAPTTGARTLSMLVAPPATVVAGVPMGSVSLRVRDDLGEAVSGARVALSVLPVGDARIDVNSSTSTDRGLLATLRCFQHSLLPHTIVARNFERICRPSLVDSTTTSSTSGNQQISELVQYSNDDGYVFFSGVSWPTAFTGYAMLRFTTDSAYKSVEQLVKVVQRKVTRLSATAVVVSTSSHEPTTMVIQPGTELSPRLKRGAVLSIVVSASIVLTAGAQTFAQEPSFISATAFGVDYHTATRNVVTADGVLYDSDPYFATTSGLVLDGAEAIVSADAARTGAFYPANYSGDATVNYTLTIPHVTVQDSSTGRFDVAVLCLGATVLVEISPELNDDAMLPSRIRPSFLFKPIESIPALRSGVVVATPIATLTSTGRVSVVEGTMFGVRIQVALPHISALEGMKAWFYLAPHPTETVGEYSTTEFARQPDKTLVQQVSDGSVDDTGAISVLLRVSIDGRVGPYALYCTVGGIACDWSNAISGSPSAMYATLDVASAVQQVSVMLTPGPWVSSDNRDVEYVLAPFATLPVVTVLDASGSPLVGKRARIVCDTSASVSSQSVSSNDAGVIAFAFVSVTSARFGIFDNVTLQLHVEVDDRRWYSFDRTIRRQPNDATELWSTDVQRTRTDLIDSSACAYVDAPSVPAAIVTGLQTTTYVTITVRTRDATYEPVAQAVAVLNITSSPLAYLPVSSWSATSDASGYAHFNVSIPAAPAWTALLASVRCAGAAWVNASATVALTATRYARFIVRRRVVSASVLSYSQETGVARIALDADWTAVNATLPIAIYSRSVWTPSFVVAYRSVLSRVALNGLVVVAAPPASGYFEINVTDPVGATQAAVAVYVDATPANLLVAQKSAANGGASTPDTITILTEAATALVTHPTLGVPFVVLEYLETLPTQPHVSVTQSDTFAPRSDVVVFAQLGIESPPDDSAEATVRWLNPTIRMSDMSLGHLVDASQGSSVVLDAFPRPPAAVTGADGVARFTSLMIEGALPNCTYRLRYCIALNVALQTSNGTASEDHCVEEGAVFAFAPTQIVLAVSSLPVATLVPGSTLPAVRVSAIQGQSAGTPTSLALSAVAVELGPHLDLLLPSPIISADPPGSLSGEVQLPADSIQVSTRVDSPTVSFIRIHVAGASVNIPVTISTIPVKMELVVPPPQHAFVEGVQTVGVRVFGFNEQPMASQRVSLSITRANTEAVSGCTGDGCGVYESASTTHATTDAEGIAMMSVVFTQATTSNFTYDFRVDLQLAELDELSEVLRQDALSASRSLGSALIASGGDYQAAAAGQGAVLLQALAAGSLAKYNSQVGQLNVDGATVRAIGGAAVALSSDPSALQSAAFAAANGASQAGGAYDATRQTTTTRLYNPVTSVELIEDPGIDFEARVPAEQLQNYTWEGRYTWDRNASVRFRFLDVNGAPVDGAPVSIEVLATPGYAGSAWIDLGRLAQYSDENGIVSFDGSTVYFGADVESIKFSARSRGSPVNTTNNYLVVSIYREALQNVLQGWAFLLVIVFLPLFAASVPHSSNTVLIISCFFALAFVTVVQIFFAYWYENYATNTMVRVYFVMLIVVAWLVAIGSLIVTLSDRLGSRAKLRRIRIWNSEGRAVDAFRYTEWMVNARVDRQPVSDEQPELSIVERAKEMVFGMRKKSDNGRREKNKGTGSIVSSPVSTSSPPVMSPNGSLSARRRMHEDPVRSSDGGNDGSPADAADGAWQMRDSRYRQVERPPLVRPEHVPDPTYYPTNIFIVFAITVVLIIVLIFVTVDLMLRARRLFAQIENSLPSIPDGDIDLARNASKIFTDVLAVTLTVVSEQDPRMSFLADIVQPLRDIDVLLVLDKVRTLVAGIQSRVYASFITGMSLGTILVVAFMIYTLWVTPIIIRKMRRGEMNTVPVYNDPQPFRVEQFIGLFVFHFAALYVMVSFVGVVFVWLVAVDVIRTYILNQIFTTLVTSAASMIVTRLMRVVQEVFLMDGTHVVRPRIYAAYSFIDLVLGVFTGIFNTVVRMALAIAFIVGAFAKLDETLFPSAFAWLDTGLIGFSTLLTMEARNSNPIALSFASFLLTDQAIRRTVAQVQARHDFVVAVRERAADEQSPLRPRPSTAAGDDRLGTPRQDEYKLPYAAFGQPWVASEIAELVEAHARSARLGLSLETLAYSNFDPRHFAPTEDAASWKSAEPSAALMISRQDEFNSTLQRGAAGVSSPAAAAQPEEPPSLFLDRSASVIATAAELSRVYIDIDRFGESHWLKHPVRHPNPLTHPLNGSELPSPMMINLGRVWLRYWQRFSRGVVVPLEPWEPYPATTTDNELDPAARIRMFDASAYVMVGTRVRRVRRRWQLAMLLLMNPSLVRFRKHHLPPREPEPEEHQRRKCVPPCC
jgi:hypothetical protein